MVVFNYENNKCYSKNPCNFADDFLTFIFMKTRILLFFLLLSFVCVSAKNSSGRLFNIDESNCINNDTLSTQKLKKSQSKMAHPKKRPQKQNSCSRTFKVNDVEFTMVFVSGGTFKMGKTSEKDDSCVFIQHTPRVKLSDYYVGETEVTQALWEAVMGENPSEFKGDSLPVVRVSWYDCQKFLSRLDSLTGQHFRLLTEAEWEFAARGGKKSRGNHRSGSKDISDVAWHCYDSDDQVHPVKTTAPNELGIYGMTGNVAEWCSDWHAPYSSKRQKNPTGPRVGSYRVVRGCYYQSNFTKECIAVVRYYERPDWEDEACGLRLALTAHPEAERTKPTWSYEKNTIKYGDIEYKMVFVPGGTFTMGATPEQENPDSDEYPTHRVTLSDYYIGETEMTQILWETLMGYNPSFHVEENCGVEMVTWDACQEFICRLNALTGKRFRLPTEAEWEFAARGGNKSRGYQYSGSNNISKVAWYVENSPCDASVKKKAPNELGIYDMSGNIWEWCSDWYGPYSPDSQTNPVGPSSGTKRVYRGGAWDRDARDCRSAVRGGLEPDCGQDYIGFRLVLSE